MMKYFLSCFELLLRKQNSYISCKGDHCREICLQRHVNPENDHIKTNQTEHKTPEIPFTEKFCLKKSTRKINISNNGFCLYHVVIMQRI